MSSAQTQTGGSEAEHIRLPTHARQQKTAQKGPLRRPQSQIATALATPNPLLAEQVEAIKGVINNYDSYLQQSIMGDSVERGAESIQHEQLCS